MTRHVNHRPTKEVFTPATGGTDPNTLNAFSGYLVDTDTDEADIQLHIPHDFGKLEQLVVCLVPVANVVDETFTVRASYAKNLEPVAMHDRTIAKTFTAIANIMREIDITDSVDAALLEARDYLGIIVSRVAGQTTNINVLGVRLKYQTQ